MKPTMVIGSTIRKKDKGPKFTPIKESIRASGRITKDMGKAFTITPTEISMSEIELSIRELVPELIDIRMEAFMRGNGRKIKKMVWGR